MQRRSPLCGALLGAAAAPPVPVPVPQEQVEREFESVLRTAPVAPAHYLLQFQMDSTELTAGSRALLPEIVAEIAARQAVNTGVVGARRHLGRQRVQLHPVPAAGPSGSGSADRPWRRRGDSGDPVPRRRESTDPHRGRRG